MPLINHTFETVSSEKNGISSFILLAAALATGLFANGRWMIPAAAWIAPVFMLQYTRQTTVKGLAAGFAGMVVSGFFMYDTLIPLHGPAFYLTITGIGIFLFLPYLADRMLSVHFRGIAATLPFPLAWTAVEYISSVFNPYGTWASTAYTQYPDRVLIQLAALFGTGGIVFLVTWFAPVILYTRNRRHRPELRRRTIVLYSIVFAVVFFYGGFRIRNESGSDRTVRISGIAAPTVNTTDLYGYYLEQTAKEAAAGARIVLWPEGAVKLEAGPEEDRYLDRCRQTARAQNIYLAVTTLTEGAAPAGLYENKLILINPQGQLEGTYLKSRPVPGEPSVRGAGRIPVFQTPYGRIALAICFDLDFPSLIRQAGKAGADILLVPGSDWKAIDPLHTQMAVFRAIENGCALVRVAGIGRSAAADCRGSEVAQTDSFTSGGCALTASVPVTGCTTLYALTGSLFSLLCIPVLILLMLYTAFTKKRI